MKKYTKPKIYPKVVTTKPASAFANAEKDSIIKKYKRWYVYYGYLNSEGKMERQPAVYFNVNREHPDFDSRLEHIKKIRNSIEKALKNGFSPIESELTVELYTVESALDFALSLKKSSVKETSYRDYENRISQFKKYLTKKGLSRTTIGDIDKGVVNGFLNNILQKSSPRNRNNTRTVLSAIFTVLEDNDLIPRNFIKNIKNIKANPERNKTYTLEKVNDIYEFLEDNDTNLLLFIKFVSYNFLRPIEVCRLQIKDIDLKNKMLQVRAKNKPVKIKIIPDILITELLKLDLTNLDAFLFTPYGVGDWDAKEENRRGYFTSKYSKVKKKLDLTKDYTIYSFRHTFITKLYRELRAKYGQSETYDKLMLITGHSTLKALTQYLRDIDAELPVDYSNYLK
ncbi:site-specific integrase [Tenacibaculum maritimum]|nr:site-specific integrase [Tenacibaculum maritimum]MDB0600349.1 site-specific integrase [Tenacibaculum maritimum]MDB0611149.1 site-specific integrase [Tenacibaculum maritimum]